VKTTISQGKLDLSFTLRTPAPAAGAPAAAGGAGLLGTSAPAGGKEKETAALQALAAAAMESVREERHEEAITRLNELLGKMPTCADCYMHLGTSYLALKKYDEAEAALKKSVETRPTVEGYTALTRLYNAQKKFDLAADASTKAVELSSAPAPLGTTPAAGAAAGAPAAGAAGAPGAPAAAAAPTGPGSETLYNQGVVLWNAGKYAEAKTAFEAAVKANPNNAEAQYQLGMANLNLGQLPAARTAFEGYLKAAPDGTRAKEVKDILGQLPK
jgi:tetratricopeptide (TPR) repeat protein